MFSMVKLKLDELDDVITVSALNVLVFTSVQEIEGLEALLHPTDPVVKVPAVYEFSHFVGKFIVAYTVEGKVIVGLI